MSPARARPGGGTAWAQAWIEPRVEDPEALSALGIARAHLAGGAALAGLRRLRLVELRGELPERAALEELLHRSTAFYNPHKERCRVRLARRERGPAEPGEALVRVLEPGGERRAPAERWWRHETGRDAEVREGRVWIVRAEAGADALGCARALGELVDRRHGLLWNPHAEDGAIAGGDAVPLPWLERDGGMEDA